MNVVIKSVSINYSSVRKKVENAQALSNGRGLEVARRMARNFFVPRKKAFLDEFLSHPVSKEIMSGPRASNTSGTLSGYGNLFSFIGFRAGSSPVENLTGYLEQRMQVQYVNYSKLSWNFNMTIPDKKDIIKQSEIPWQKGASWALEMEKGISGLGSYMYGDRFSRSRSITGQQAKNSLRPEVAVRTPYLGSMLRRFTKQIQKGSLAKI